MTAKAGHNSLSKDKLEAVVDRIVRLEEEKAATASDIRDVYAESKSNGFDVKALRVVVKLKMQDAEKRRAQEEHEAMVDTYRVALGLERGLDGTGLGNAALKRDLGIKETAGL